MSRIYDRATIPHFLHVEHERVSAVPLDGIRQIPDEADRWWKRWDSEIPLALQEQCDDAIEAAMLEHRRRREAKLQGVSTDEYEPFDSNDLD